MIQGHDIRKHVLTCFGGAGGQHACAVAQSLGIPQVFIHKYSSILSAVGMGVADVVHEEQKPFSGFLSANVEKASTELELLKDEAISELIQQVKMDLPLLCFAELIIVAIVKLEK